MTNPPYSGTHMQRAVEIAVSTRKPFALLVPNFVYKKLWFTQAVETNKDHFKPMFVAPTRPWASPTPSLLALVRGVLSRRR